MTFIHGVNYPWSTDGQTIFYGLDFGANVWGSHLGVSTRRDAIARDFDYEHSPMSVRSVIWNKRYPRHVKASGAAAF